jgi:hypothetical protein
VVLCCSPPAEGLLRGAWKLVWARGGSRLWLAQDPLAGCVPPPPRRNVRCARPPAYHTVPSLAQGKLSGGPCVPQFQLFSGGGGGDL